MKRLLGLLAVLIGCGESETTMFQKISPAASGVSFVNVIHNVDSVNILNYIYYYNGGGVGAGDINNDGLIDLFFAGNHTNDALYLNQGDWHFEEVTAAAGIVHNGWSTGVAMVDINADGWLDIYVSRAGGFRQKELRKNALYINQRDGTFEELAGEYGIADDANTTSSAFFDYDRDGDLDLYVMNHGNQRERVNIPLPLKKDGKEESNDHFYENVNGFFEEKTVEAGFLVEGYGLGLSIADFNGDYWPDIYVANDFVFSDLLYINNQDGTFSERADDFFDHQSYNSMGSDLGDINNDGRMDLVTLDMLPESNQRQKSMMGAMNYDQFNQIVSRGYKHQYMRNMLYLNNGERFREIGRFAGMYATDWSWAPLFADFNHDRYIDLFVSNGYYKDITDKDFIKYSQDIIRFTSGAAADSILLAALENLEEVKLPNYMFKNTGHQRFDNVTGDWLGKNATLSNGAVYADLDNDGDLDLVTNDINQPAGIYRNEMISGRHYLQLRLIGSGMNKEAIGAEVAIYTKGEILSRNYYPYRGFLGSMNGPLHFGLGDAVVIDSLKVWWPNGYVSTFENLPVDTVISLSDKKAIKEKPDPTLTDIKEKTVSIPGLSFMHREDPLVDFHIQALLPGMMSREGPALAVGDLNRDGKEDVYIGGAKDQSSMVFYQQEKGFDRIVFDRESSYEDVDAAIADLDSDGINDLLVVTGGYEQLQDRIYFGQPDSSLSRAVLLPHQPVSAGVIAVEDVDGDLDPDVFIGGRFEPGQYPADPISSLLLNDQGGFQPAKGWPKKLGMITGASWADMDGNGTPDLVVSREWKPLMILYNQQGTFNFTREVGQPGFWRKVVLTDIDMDGDRDIVAGNYGLNNDFNVTAETPLEMYAADFDNNGSTDPVITRYYGNTSFPMAPRDALLRQLPSMQNRVFRYETYANATIRQLLTPEELSQAEYHRISELRTGIFINQPTGFEFVTLPVSAQYGPVQDIEVTDINGDALKDLILVGNDFDVEVLAGRQDAQRGLVLVQDVNGEFKPLGEFHLTNSRKVQRLSFDGRDYWVVAQNNDSLRIVDLDIYKGDHRY